MSRRRGEIYQPEPVVKQSVQPSVIIEDPIVHVETSAPVQQSPHYPYAPKATPEEIAAYRSRERELLAAYKLSPGKCPLCSKPITKGIFGHLSVCIRRSP